MGKVIGILLLTVLMCHSRCSAQFFSTDDKLKDEYFLREVKVIDEFIERFNDEKTSFIRREYKKENRTYDLSHKQILISLFNLDNPAWSKNAYLEDFFRDASDSLHPPRLSFTDTNWYAEANCIFTYNKKQLEITLILQIQVEKNNGAKWMIAGIGESPAFSSASTVLKEADGYKVRDAPKFMATSNSGTNFVDLHNVFTDKKYMLDYFKPELLATDKAKAFLNLVLQNKFDFKYVKDARFHFYQLPNWIFVVEDFERSGMNSGWLINDVRRAPENEKLVLKRQLLHR